jgi:hypothetical protein
MNKSPVAKLLSAFKREMQRAVSTMSDAKRRKLVKELKDRYRDELGVYYVDEYVVHRHFRSHPRRPRGVIPITRRGTIRTESLARTVH